jgi:hypothetical protein
MHIEIRTGRRATLPSASYERPEARTMIPTPGLSQFEFRAGHFTSSPPAEAKAVITAEGTYYITAGL